MREKRTRIIFESTPADTALQWAVCPCHLVTALTKSPTIWLLGDGKPGHENQELGLADAISRRMPCEVYRISLAGKRRLLHRIQAAKRASTVFPKPDLIVGAGHATHVALWWLARKYQARSIVLMKPSLPMSWFDLCIVPAHDFKTTPTRQNIIVTQGALNRVAPPNSIPRTGGIILIGGPSNTLGWNGDTLLREIIAISARGSWLLTDSRRTPAGFVQEIKRRVPQMEIFSHQDTDPDWLPAKLATTAEVWVTQDSVSMVYEALSSGASVGVLAPPRTQPNSRVRRGLEVLISEGFLTPFEDWEKTKTLEAPPSILREADRCADKIIQKWLTPPQPQTK
jgi:uncharacterized protein